MMFFAVLSLVQSVHGICAASYNGGSPSPVCCGQPDGTVTSKMHICPSSRPTCSGYVLFVKWGSCMEGDLHNGTNGTNDHNTNHNDTLYLLTGQGLCTGPASDFGSGSELPGYAFNGGVAGYFKNSTSLTACQQECINIAKCNSLSHFWEHCYLYEASDCPQSTHVQVSQFASYAKRVLPVKCKFSSTVVPEYTASSASSVLGNAAIGQAESCALGRLDSTDAWCAAVNSAGQWWQMDLGSLKQIAGVVTQGRYNAVDGHYVSSYKVDVSSDGSLWNNVDAGHIFNVHTPQNNDKIVNMFASPTIGRYVRIVAQTWVGHISLRAGVRVCQASCGEEYYTLPNLNNVVMRNPYLANRGDCANDYSLGFYHAQTTWSKLNIDLDTLQVDVRDRAFAMTTSQGFPSTYDLDFGAPWDCQTSHSTNATAIIDLRGTPFAVAGDSACSCQGNERVQCLCSQWTTYGWDSAISLNCVDANQYCTLGCGGGAGGCRVATGRLQLELADGVFEHVCQACNWACYLARYPDLRTAFGSNETLAETHYLIQGAHENRDCTCDGWPVPAGFVSCQYAVYTSETAAAFFCEACNWACYLARYSDLRTAFGSNETKAETHYLMQGGPHEGRDCTCDDAPVTNAPGTSDGPSFGPGTTDGPNSSFGPSDAHIQQSCGGTAGVDGRDCRVNGVWWVNITVQGWTANVDGMMTHADCVAFCNVEITCVACAQSSPNFNWAVTTVDAFVPCNTGDTCDPLVSYSTPGCLPAWSTYTSGTGDMGYDDNYRGWYDVQGTGCCNDYCRWVGNSGSGGNAASGVFGTSAWSCALAGTTTHHSAQGLYNPQQFSKCSGQGDAPGTYAPGTSDGPNSSFGPGTSYGPNSSFGPSDAPGTSDGPNSSFGPSDGPNSSFGPGTSDGPNSSFGPGTTDGPISSFGPSDGPGTTDGPNSSFGPSDGPGTNDGPNSSFGPSDGPSSSFGPSDGPGTSDGPNSSFGPSDGSGTSDGPNSSFGPGTSDTVTETDAATTTTATPGTNATIDDTVSSGAPTIHKTIFALVVAVFSLVI